MEAVVYLDAPPENEIALPHPAMRIAVLAPAPLLATTIHSGSLREIGRTAQRLVRWCASHNYSFPQCGLALREVHLFGHTPAGTQLPEEGVVELQLPVEAPSS